MAFNATPQPLWDWLKEYREDGADVAAFPTSNGKRYSLYTVDPDDKETGLVHVASFANSLEIADRSSNPQEQTRQNIALNAILTDAKKASHYMVCFCVVDDDSIEYQVAHGKKREDALKDFGKTFLVVTEPQTKKSDAYRTYDEVKSESARTGVKADAKSSKTGKKVSK